MIPLQLNKLMLSLVLLLLACVTSATASDCSAVLPYIQVSSDANTQKYNSQRLADWLLSDTHSSFSDAYSSSMSLSFPIDGFPVEIGGTSRDNNWSEYKQKLARIVINESLATEMQRTQIHTVLEKGLDAWQKCIESDGLHFWNESIPGDRTVIVAARYNSSDDNHPTTGITAIEITPNNSVDCPKRKATPLGHSKQVWSCSRVSNDPVTITLVTKTSGSVAVHIPAFVLCTETVETNTETCVEGFEGGKVVQRKLCVAGVNGSTSDWTMIQDNCKPTNCRHAETIVKSLAAGLWGDGKISQEEITYFSDRLQNASDSTRGIARSLVKDQRFLDSVGRLMCDCPAGHEGYVGNHTQLLIATYALISKAYKRVLHRDAPTFEANYRFFTGPTDSYFGWINNGVYVDRERLGRLATSWIDSNDWTTRFGENGLPTDDNKPVLMFCGK